MATESSSTGRPRRFTSQQVLQRLAEWNANSDESLDDSGDNEVSNSSNSDQESDEEYRLPVDDGGDRPVDLPVERAVQR